MRVCVRSVTAASLPAVETSSQCVDSRNGIFALRPGQFPSPYPVHEQHTAQYSLPKLLPHRRRSQPSESNARTDSRTERRRSPESSQLSDPESSTTREKLPRRPCVACVCICVRVLAGAVCCRGCQAREHQRQVDQGGTAPLPLIASK